MNTMEKTEGLINDVIEDIINNVLNTTALFHSKAPIGRRRENTAPETINVLKEGELRQKELYEKRHSLKKAVKRKVRFQKENKQERNTSKINAGNNRETGRRHTTTKKYQRQSAKEQSAAEEKKNNLIDMGKHNYLYNGDLIATKSMALVKIPTYKPSVFVKNHDGSSTELKERPRKSMRCKMRKISTLTATK